jgi:hypothetical protein
MNEYENKLGGRDLAAYGIVYGAWIAMCAVSAYAMMLLRSAFPAPLVILLARNPYYDTHTVELKGMVNSIDRLVLIVLAIIWVVYILWVEETFRSSVARSRERRAKARMASDSTAHVESGLQRWSLDLFPRRLAIAAAFPVGALVIYGIIEGITWLIVHL